MTGAQKDITIIPFEEALAFHFTKLNTGWLEKYFFVEPIGYEMLSNPQQFFVDKGGYIFLRGG